MNIRQEGMGLCKVVKPSGAVCNNPIMQTVGQPGVAGVCFACLADSEPKTGRTVVVTGEDGDTKATAGAITGRVQLEEVSHTVQSAGVPPPMRATQPVTSPPVQTGTIVLVVTVEELHDANIIRTLLQKIYDGIDNAPPAPTLKEQKRAIKLQERIEELIKAMETK